MGTTLAATYVHFLSDARHLDHLRPHTLRAYCYELALVAADPRFAADLDALSLAELEGWIARDTAAAPPPDRLVLTILRETGMRAGEGGAAHPDVPRGP